MVQTIRAGVWKSKYSWSGSSFAAVLTVLKNHRMRRMGQSSNLGTSSMQLHGQPFYSRWRGLCRSSTVFRKMQRHCAISWRRTTESNVKLNVWAVQDEMPAGMLRDCGNVQEYTSMIQGCVNNFNLCAENSTGMMPMSGHSYYLMQGLPMDDDWRSFTKLMYDMIDTIADKLEEIVTMIKAHEARLKLKDDSKVAAMFSRLQMKSDKWWPIRKSRMTRDSDSDRIGSISDSEKHPRRHTQECYRCHKIGHIAWYYPSTVLVPSSAATDTAAATETTTTSIENYWMTGTGGSASKESWYLDFTPRSHICRDRRKFERYTEYTLREE